MGFYLSKGYDYVRFYEHMPLHMSIGLLCVHKREMLIIKRRLIIQSKHNLFKNKNG